MNENIEKPMIVVRQEFADKLVKDINNCGLPLFVVEPILKDIYLEIKAMLQKQYNAELAQYKTRLQEVQKEK